MDQPCLSTFSLRAGNHQIPPRDEQIPRICSLSVAVRNEGRPWHQFTQRADGRPRRRAGVARCLSALRASSGDFGPTERSLVRSMPLCSRAGLWSACWRAALSRGQTPWTPTDKGETRVRASAFKVTEPNRQSSPRFPREAGDLAPIRVEIRNLTQRRKDAEAQKDEERIWFYLLFSFLRPCVFAPLR